MAKVNILHLIESGLIEWPTLKRDADFIIIDGCS